MLSALIAPNLGIPASAFVVFDFRLIGGKLEVNFQALTVGATATIITSLVTKIEATDLAGGCFAVIESDPLFSNVCTASLPVKLNVPAGVLYLKRALIGDKLVVDL